MTNTKHLFDNTPIPALGFGTWEIGGRKQKDASHDKQAVCAICKAIDLGMTHIDTAEKYGNGHTEKLTGEAIQNYDRDKLFITSKVAEYHLNHDDLINAAENSLRRLKTDYLDLYLIHAYNPKIPLRESVEAMNELARSGKVRYIGVSNFNVSQMKEFIDYSETPLAANQVEFNLTTRNKGKFNINMEKEILPFCWENDILFISWRPLGKGDFIEDPPEVLKQVSEKYNKTPAQIALNWLLRKPSVITIPKALDPAHIQENAGAMGWQLDPEDIRSLDILHN